MRLTKLGAALALGALACGGGGDQQQQAQQTPAVEQPAGAVVDVRMTGTGTTAAFEPNAITIAPGTTVRFHNVSGGPHNVAFWVDSIPVGAAAVLDAAMTGRTMSAMSSLMLTQPNETYDISFANAPAGAYKTYCLPHLAMGMKLTITVQ